MDCIVVGAGAVGLDTAILLAETAWRLLPRRARRMAANPARPGPRVAHVTCETDDHHRDITVTRTGSPLVQAMSRSASSSRFVS